MTKDETPGRETKNTLTVHGRKTDNIFTLHGAGEDSGTYAVGFVLANSPSFLAQFMKSWEDDTKIHIKDTKDIIIELQKRRKDKNGQGIRTDIEVGIKDNFRLIIEAKKGWGHANEGQMKRYADSFEDTDGEAYLMTISQAGEGRKYSFPDSSEKDFPVSHRSWREIQALVKLARNNQSNDDRENILLENLFIHLAHYVFYKGEDVYVVPLDPNRMTEQKFSYLQVVTEGIGYFHPIERYPEERAPEYLGFRWGKELHLVRKVKKWTTGTEFFKEGKKGGECMWSDPEEIVHLISYHEAENLLPGGKPIPSGKINHRGNQLCDRELLLSGNYTFEQVVRLTRDKRRQEFMEREETAKVAWQEFLKENKLN